MIEKAIAMVSSWTMRRISVMGFRTPSTRRMGKAPTFRWRSEALRSTAIFRRSFICIGLAYAPRAGKVEGPELDAGFHRHGRQPAVAVFDVPRQQAEEVLLEPLSDRAAPARSHGDPVHRTDRRDLRSGSGEEDL